MNFLRKKYIIILSATILIFVAVISFIAVQSHYDSINESPSNNIAYKNILAADAVDTLNPADSPTPLQNPPAIVKSVYVTGSSAGSKGYGEYLNSLFKATQINAVVIDIKDSFGIVSYKTGVQKVEKYNAYSPEIPDIDSLVKNLHSQGIYVIGRIVVFQDPIFAKNRPGLAVYDISKTQILSKPTLWQDNLGLSWVDPASEEARDYNIDIAKDAAQHGFDEINFDYVRFPSDGQTKNMGFPVWDKKTPRHLIIKNFFQKVRDSLPNTKISIDLFGQTTSNTDDMGVGQVIEDSFGYFDYVCPMLYPSLYAPGFLGYKNPAEHPYEIISYALNSAIARQKAYAAENNKLNSSLSNTAINPAKIRPWIQNFNLGATYNAPMVSQEIKAVSDSMGNDFNGFMLWNSLNMYAEDAIGIKNTIPK